MTATDLRDRLLRLKAANPAYTAHYVASLVPIDPTLLSRMLRGHRPMPDDVAARLGAKLRPLEAAERVAAQARDSVLREIGE